VVGIIVQYNAAVFTRISADRKFPDTRSGDEEKCRYKRMFCTRLHADFGILAKLTEIAWLICHSGTRLVLSHSLCNPYSRFAMFFGFPQWSDAALWKSCGCSAAPLCVTVDKRRHPAATDVQSRHTMSINQVPSRGMHFAPKTNTQMFVWLWQTDFPIRISREQSLPAHPSW
jgi:hypothetical protein